MEEMKEMESGEPLKTSAFSRRHFLIGTGLLGVGVGALTVSACGRKKGAVNSSAETSDADFIIVGGGHNSLSCAMVLAHAGHKVLILEGAGEMGGAAKTREITLPGFKHDLYAANIGLFLGSPTFQEFKDKLFSQGFKPVVSECPMASVFPDGTGMGIYKDARKTFASFKAVSEADADAWVRLYAYFNETAPHFLPLLQQPMPSFAALRQAWRLVRKLGGNGASDLAAMLLKSPRQFCEHWFENPKTQALFLPWAMHLDFGPDVPGGATFPFVEPPIYASFGMPLSEGGVGNLIAGMAGVVKRQGGAFKTGEKVDRILLRNGQAVGVLTASGQKIYARKSIIANVTPHQMVTQLLDKAVLPDTYVQKSLRYRFGPGTMMIHLALDGPVEWAAGTEYSKFNYVHIAPFASDLARTYTDAMNGVLPESPLLIVGQLSVTDPTRAPEGKHLLWIQVRLLPKAPIADAVQGKNAISPRSWPDIKEQYADRMIRKLEAYAPGISSRILKRVVLAPSDLAQDNPNLVGGDSLSGSHHLDQFYMFRPFAGWSRYETPIKGLYMVGASTWPGAGLHAASGHLLGKDLLDLY
jgi:phytoene dehydrogenase-like protein